MTPENVKRLAEKICGTNGIIWDKTVPECIEVVESLLCEAMEEVRKDEWANNMKHCEACGKNARYEAYTRAAEVARKHPCVDQDQGEEIAAAIEKLKDTI